MKNWDNPSVYGKDESQKKAIRDAFGVVPDSNTEYRYSYLVRSSQGGIVSAHRTKEEAIESLHSGALQGAGCITHERRLFLKENNE